MATDVTGGTPNRGVVNSSEDELVKDLARTTVSGKGDGTEDKASNSGITVNTTFEMRHEKGSSPQDGYNQFA